MKNNNYRCKLNVTTFPNRLLNSILCTFTIGISFIGINNQANAFSVQGNETIDSFYLEFDGLPQGNNADTWDSTQNKYNYFSRVYNPNIQSGTPLSLKYWSVLLKVEKGNYTLKASHLVDPHIPLPDVASLGPVVKPIPGFLPNATVFTDKYKVEHTDSEGDHSDKYTVDYSPISKTLAISGNHCSCSVFKFSSSRLAMISFPSFLAQICSIKCAPVPEPNQVAGSALALAFFWLIRRKNRCSNRL